MKKILSVVDFLNENENENSQELLNNSSNKIAFDLVFDYAFKPLIENSIPITIRRSRSFFKIIKLIGPNIYFETSNGNSAEDYKISKNTIKSMYEKGENDIVLSSGNKGYYDGVLKFLQDKALELSGGKESTDDLKIEPKNKQIGEVKENPFKQAICVIGDSGAGKSVTTTKILEHDGHNFNFIIPTSTTTGLLSQFSPKNHEYVPSVLGEMIIESAENPSELYTAVFDECHKSNVIEMINDELLQCISTKRNNGLRFISLDRNTIDLYKNEAQEIPLRIDRYNIYLPDNFGFIFISSKTKVIANNEDFFNRVDIIILTQEDRNINTSQELINKILKDEKNKLKSDYDV